MGDGEGKEESGESILALQRLVSVTKTLLRVLDYVPDSEAFSLGLVSELVS